MKKLLALVLSLIMIMTSVFIVPFSAQAEQYPILPIPGTISTQCLTNESKYVSGNEKGRINYTYNVPSAGTLRLNINATLAGYDKDGQFSMRFETSFSNTKFYSDFESGFKGYINDYIEYDILPGTYTLTFFSYGNESPVNCTISTTFTSKAQSFYADNNTVTNVIAYGNEISLDKRYYGVFPAAVKENYTSDYMDITKAKTSFSYKFNFKFDGGNLYAGFEGERESQLYPNSDYTHMSDAFYLYDGNGHTVWPSKYNYDNLLYENLKAGEYFIAIKDWAGPYSFYLTQNLYRFYRAEANANNPQTKKKITKPKKAKIKKVKGYKKALEVSYAKVSGASGYQLQVATEKKFKKIKKTVTAKKSKTKVKISKLKKKKKYYVRVRAYKSASGKKVYGAWSKVKTVKTK